MKPEKGTAPLLSPELLATGDASSLRSNADWTEKRGGGGGSKGGMEMEWSGRLVWKDADRKKVCAFIKEEGEPR